MCIYFGRATCSYCRTFVAMLDKVIENTDTVIYYLDTEDAENRAYLTEIRESYAIDTVPALLYVYNVGENVEKYSNEKELKVFLNR